MCAKDVHKVLLQQHVEVCLERSAEGASAGAEDASAGDASAGGWGRRRGPAASATTAGTATPFVTAGAFAERLANARRCGARQRRWSVPPRRASCDVRCARFWCREKQRRATRRVLAVEDEAIRRARRDGPFSAARVAFARRRRTSERAESARRLFRPAESARPPSTDRTKPNEPLEPKEEETEGDVRGEGDADVERRRAESAVAVGDGGLLPFPVRVMSGDHRDCGICLQRFDARAGVERHVLWPCQHARQCGDCAIRIWQVPKSKRRCPWCKSKIDIRPRPFKPFL